MTDPIPPASTPDHVAADGGDTTTSGDTAETILIAGTASHVGKSTVAAGVCRRLTDAGISVAPFKAQNMSNEARAVVRPDAVRGRSHPRDDTGETDRSESPAFGEIGVSQAVQARAAGVRPTTDHNPVLLKPRGGGESQLVTDGVAVGHYPAATYYDDHWGDARAAAEAAHDRLATDHDVIVAEGAGSIAEINFHDRDLANIETARFADASILLVADIERGGVFASIVGTLELLPDDIRDRVAGVLITKFRGDRSLLKPGIEAVESRTGVPVLSVLPYDDPGLPEEDSVSLPDPGERAIRGDDDGVGDGHTVTVAVPRLPRASNTADVDPLAAVPGVRVAFRPLDDPLNDADAAVLTGTKNTVDDLRALREAGLHDRLRGFDGPVVGLCGGYQLLGRRLVDADIEGVGGEPADGTDAAGDARTALRGVGLLPVETAFSHRKQVAPATWDLDGVGPVAGASGSVEGYEIHGGQTRLATPPAEEDGPTTGATDGTESVAFPFTAADREPVTLGAARGSVLGTYLHGLFENRTAREAFVDCVFAQSATSRPTPGESDTRVTDPYDRAAGLVAGVPLGNLLESVSD